MVLEEEDVVSAIADRPECELGGGDAELPSAVTTPELPEDIEGAWRAEAVE